MNPKSLAREASFAWTKSRNWQTRSTLLAATCRFHINNKLRKSKLSLPPIDVDVTVGQRPVTVRLRQHTGDLFIFYEVLAFGAYSLPPAFLPEDQVHTIVDCGANIGMSALYFSQRYPRARIFAIEAEPTNFQLLKQNTAAIDRIVPIEGAVVGQPTKSVRFGVDRPAWGNGIIDGNAGGNSVEVAAITLDELAAQHGIDRIDFLKVDIEGGEVDLFSRPQFLSKVGLVAIELHGDYTLDKFQEAIAQQGFRADAVGAHPGVRIVTARRKE